MPEQTDQPKPVEGQSSEGQASEAQSTGAQLAEAQPAGPMTDVPNRQYAWPAPQPPVLSPSRSAKPPRELPRWTAFAMSAALLGATSFDTTMHNGMGAAWLLAVFASSVALLRVSQTQPGKSVRFASVVGAILVASTAVLRSSPWISTLAVVGSFALLALAAATSFASEISSALLLILRPINFVFDWLLLAYRATSGLRQRTRGAKPARAKVGAVLRGVGIALPITIILFSLLASADSILGSAFDWFHIPEVNAAPFISHIAGIVFSFAAIVALIHSAAQPKVLDANGNGGLYGNAKAPRTSRTTETLIVLGSVIAVLVAFAAAQVAAALGGDQLIQSTSGLTYAAHARSGFFQLLAAAFLVAAVLAGARWATRSSDRVNRTTRADRTITSLVLVVIALTLLVVFSAHRRLSLYEAAYGWTMLRLMAHMAIAWVGFALFVAGLRWAGVGQNTNHDLAAWTVPVMIACTCLGFVGLALANPEARVVSANWNRIQPGEFPSPEMVDFDSPEADTISTLLKQKELPANTRAQLCAAVPDLRTDRHWAAWRWADSAAKRALDDSCDPTIKF